MLTNATSKPHVTGVTIESKARELFKNLPCKRERTVSKGKNTLTAVTLP